MNLTRRDFSLRTLLAPALLTANAFSLGGAYAQQVPAPSSQSYRRLASGQPHNTPETPEVLEFFSYACPHCFDLERYLTSWSEHLPPGVAFVRVPVPFLMSAEVLMRSYYAFMMMGTEKVMTPVVFSAIHESRQHADTLESVATLVKGVGADSARFLALAKSFGITTKVEQARALVMSYDINSTPTLVVNGQFATSPTMAGGHPQALAVVDGLLGMSHSTSRR